MYTVNSMNTISTANMHCEFCHETALALESVLRRLVNLERGLQQSREVSDLNEMLNSSSSNPLSSSNATTNPSTVSELSPPSLQAAAELRRSSSVSSMTSDVQRIDLDRYLLPYFIY